MRSSLKSTSENAMTTEVKQQELRGESHEVLLSNSLIMCTRPLHQTSHRQEYLEAETVVPAKGSVAALMGEQPWRGFE